MLRLFKLTLHFDVHYVLHLFKLTLHFDVHYALRLFKLTLHFDVHYALRLFKLTLHFDVHYALRLFKLTLHFDVHYVLCLFSNLSCKLGAVQISIIITTFKTLTCRVRLPPRFMVPDPSLLVCSHSMTVDVSL